MPHTKRGTLLSLVTDQTDKKISARDMLQSAQGTHVSHAVHPAPVQLAQWLHQKYSPRWVGRPPHIYRRIIASSDGALAPIVQLTPCRYRTSLPPQAI